MLLNADIVLFVALEKVSIYYYHMTSCKVCQNDVIIWSCGDMLPHKSLKMNVVPNDDLCFYNNIRYSELNLHCIFIKQRRNPKIG